MSGIRRITPFSKALICGAIVFVLSALPETIAQTSGSARKHPPADPAAQALNRLLADAQDAVNRQDYAAAAQDYQDYLAKKPDDASVHYNLGYVYTAMRRPDDAKAEYEKAVSLDPKMGPAYLNLGITLLASDPAAAVEPLQKAAELMPDQARPRFLLGAALDRSGKPTAAIEQYEAAEKLGDKDFDIHLSFGRALLIFGRAADAELELHQALALRPGGPDAAPVHLELAHSLVAQKKLEPAAAELAAYLEAQPKDTTARIDRASLLVDLTKYDDALAELDRAAAAGPESLRALNLRSQIYYQQKRYDDLIAVLQKAAALAPRDAGIAARLGEAYLAKKDYPDAGHALVAAYNLDPAATDVLVEVVEAEYEAKNYATALQALDTLSKHKDLPAGSWFIRASCYDKLGQPAAALDAYQRFLQLNKDENSDMYFASSARVRELTRELQNKKR
ncbi:MAG: tetratricopeptide repeat protein [Candidatus Acidiferrales bacterium]